MKDWKEISGWRKEQKMENPYDDCCYFTFKKWENRTGDKKRIYINDYKHRTIGFLYETSEGWKLDLIDRQGNRDEEIEMAIANYKKEEELK